MSGVKGKNIFQNTCIANPMINSKNSVLAACIETTRETSCYRVLIIEKRINEINSDFQ